jgi:hypothetical protein
MREPKHPWAAHVHWLLKDLRDGRGDLPLGQAQIQLLARTLENALDEAFRTGLELGRRRRAAPEPAGEPRRAPQPAPLSFWTK